MDAEDDAKPRKRVVTPARREQNRVAQKLYRQRRKSRQQALRERNQEKPTRPLVLRPQPSPRTTSDGAFSSGNAEFRVVGQEEVLLDGSQRETAAVLDHSPSCDPEYVRWVDVQSAQVSLVLQSDGNSVGHLDRSLGTRVQDAFPREGNPCSDGSCQFSVTSNNPQALPGLTDQDTGLHSMFGSYASDRPSRQLFSRRASGSLLHDGTIPMPPTRACTIQEPSALWDAPALGVSQLTSPTVDSPAQPDIITDEATQALLPDPYQNSIQLAKTITYSAFLSNALSLNFSIRELVYSNCRGTQSPFYRASTPQSDAREVVAAVSSPSMPSHLQPTLQQVLIPHHPFIDLLPFPALRSRVIALSASMPHVFDIMELKVDIYVRGGLVCWVGGTSGQPWDMRSWEAAPWFLRKWRLLVDGEDGELWKSSVWWQGMRNEGSASTSL